MGRKANYSEKEKKGPGRKARKQKPPIIPTHLQGICQLFVHFKY